ncbi:MAG: 7-carboxy-7-deazaguanine synthase QueE [Flavobacteriales bacterium]|nr:7-carboxy-7-deazaguanine synthase QueE [Flavobacteriales bacterium]MDG1765771.1 7-carboxy-7-deazaguanine synthase QueE [Flavobacteriales bacterium]
MEQSTALIPIMEQFYTVQGEGAFTGSPAYFIRTGGCDVGCVWCDVKESWDASAHPGKSAQSIVEDVLDSGANIAVITGGEPCMYNLLELTSLLREAGIRTHLETSGVYPITGDWDWVCFSPKKFKKPLAEAYEKANELKVVVYHQSDIVWAQNHADLLNKEAQRFLQPEWDKQEQNLPLILNYVRNNPSWRLSLQTHKFIGIP